MSNSAGDHKRQETATDPGESACLTGHGTSSREESTAQAAAACGDCVAVVLGAATTISLAFLQAGALLIDVCWRAISKSCCDQGVPRGPPRYYVPSNRVAYVYEEPVRVYVPRAPSGYYSGSTNTFIPTTPYL